MTENDGRPGGENTEATNEPSSKAAHNGTPIIGYREGVWLYREAGWRGVLPLPPARKFPPPKGFTGHDGAWPTDEKIAEWVDNKPADANLMLRINYGLVGIDVDAYDDKTGERTLKEAESRWGPLPLTFRNSARSEDQVSGHRLFRVPESVLFGGVISFPDLGIGDIEIIQPHHRFIVAWPSIHPKNSKMYRWYDTNGALMPEGQVPGVDELPDLPVEWIEALSRDAVREMVFDGSSSDKTSARRAQINEDMYERLIEMQDDSVPDAVVGRRVDRAVAELTGGTGSRYDTTRDHVAGLMRLRAMGYIGVPRALNRLFKVYVDVVSESRPQLVAEAEFLRFTEGAAALVAATPPEGSEQAEDEFWNQRDILSHIRAFARSRSVAPYAVLGAVLRRAITLVPPSVQLPAIVGDAASVNLFTVSVGRSGQGKDAANGVGRSAVVFVTPDGDEIDDPPSAVGIGSGEGLAKAMRPTGDDESVPMRVNLEVPEITTLGAIAVRQGATVVGELLKAYTGQQLGFTNARRETTSFVPAHSYRLCLGVGVQPENADVLLNREKDGLPQRFLWLPTIDPHAPPPSEDDEPVRAARLTVPTSFPPVVPGTPYFVGTPASARAAIRKHRHLVRIGDAHIDPLDGHLMLTRLKVSFGLALLDGRSRVTDDDWVIAGQLVEVSNRERAKLRKGAIDRRRKANLARANDLADRQQILGERQAQDNRTRVWKTITRKLSRVESATRRELQRACDSSIARDFPAVFDDAVDDGKFVKEGDGDTAKYRLGPE